MNGWGGPRFPVGENPSQAHPLETVALWAVGALIMIAAHPVVSGSTLWTALQADPGLRFTFRRWARSLQDFRATLATRQKHGLWMRAC